MSLRFFEQAVVCGHQIFTPRRLGGGDVEGVEASDGETLNLGCPAGDRFHHRNMEARILSHRKGVGTMICIGIAEEFLNQIVAGDDGETSGKGFVQDPLHGLSFQPDTDLGEIVEGTVEAA